MLFVKKLSDSAEERLEESAEGGDDSGITTDRILIAGLTRGLRMQDAEVMTLGMWTDYILEWNEMDKEAEKQSRNKSGKEETVRRATQADFNRFC